MNKIQWLGIILLTISALVSCQKKVLFGENHFFEDGMWAAQDTISFTVEINDTINPYSFLLNVRNNNSYPRSRLYLFVETLLPENIYAKDTLAIILAEANGKWIGKGYGDIKENELLIRDQIRFRQTGEYQFHFVHGMRLDSLSGIESIGIRIESSK